MYKDPMSPAFGAPDVFDTITSQALPADVASKYKEQPWKVLGLEPGEEIHPAVWNLPGNKRVEVLVKLGAIDSYGTDGNGSH
jgi:hypothetical protein